jgi:hypothetical protein
VAWVDNSVVSPNNHAGCGPAATHFLCFAKESKQRKASAGKLPFGFAPKSAVKREMKQTRLRLRQVSFLIRFTADFDASFQAQFVRRTRIQPSTRHKFRCLSNTAQHLHASAVLWFAVEIGSAYSSS